MSPAGWHGGKRAAAGAARLWENTVFVVLLTVPVVMCVIGSRHAPFVADEPSLIAAAAEANAQGRLAPSGLGGSFGIPYGPTPTHIYQLLLLVSGSDLERVVLIRSLMFIVLVTVGLVWLSSELELWRWLAPALLVAPTLIIESFHLWDNTFAIPASILTLASYARFVRTKNTPSLVGWVLGCLVLLAVHLSTIPLVLAVVGDAVWRNRPARAGAWTATVLTVVLFGWTIREYPFQVARIVRYRLAEQDRVFEQPAETQAAAVVAVERARPRMPSIHPEFSRPEAAVFALCGATVLAGYQMEIHPDVLQGLLGATASAARHVGWVMVLLAVSGAMIAMRRLWARPPAPVPPQAIAVYRVTLVALILQVFLFAGAKVLGAMHYLNGTWAVPVVLVWIAVSAIRPQAFAGALVVVIAACSLVVDLACLSHLHQNSGSRLVYGPDLNQQVHAVRTALRHGATVYTNVPNLILFPHALQTVASFEPPAVVSAPSDKDMVPLIEYRDQGLDDAHLHVRLGSLASLSMDDYLKIDLFHVQGRGYD